MILAVAPDIVREPAPGGLYPVAFALETAFGRCVGVALDAALAADPASLTATLHPEEQPLCRGMHGARLVEFAGGRLASRLARAGMPDAEAPTLRGPGGAPFVSRRVSISISHTRRLAVALASAGPGHAIGVDIEALDDDAAGALLAERIMSDQESAAEPLGIVERLSLKEAAYKALFPRVGHIPLRRISVARSGARRTAFRVTTTAGVLAAESRMLLGHVLSLARTA